MKIRFRIQFILIFVACVLLTCSCKIDTPGEGTASNSIENALNCSIANNNKLACKERKKLPASVRNALMPRLNLPNHTSIVSSQDEPHFDVSVNNVPAKDFFLGLVDGTRYSVSLSPLLTGNISLELKNVTVVQAMEAVRDAYGYEFERTSYGFQVFPKRLESRIFTINSLDLVRKGKSSVSISSGQITDVVNTAGISSSSTVSAGTIDTDQTANFWDSLKQNLDTLIGKEDGRSVVVNSQSGVVIVKAFPDELRSVAQYLDYIQNIMQREVIIEAKVLEIELNAQYQSGVNWKALGITVGNLDNVPLTQNTPTFNPAFTLNISDGGAFNSVIQLLNSQGKVNILSSPRITTTNNQKAIIKVGEDRFFVTNVSSNTTATTGGQTTAANVTLTPFFSGISLDVTPQINENGQITLHIHPIVSKVVQDNQEFTVNGQLQQLPLAKSDIRESDSIVRAANRQVIVIGGLMENTSFEYTDSVPGADKLRDIGGLFKHINNSAAKFELVILLRPIIADNTCTWQERLKEATMTFKNMQGEYQYNLSSDRKPLTPICDDHPKIEK